MIIVYIPSILFLISITWHDIKIFTGLGLFTTVFCMLIPTGELRMRTIMAIPISLYRISVIHFRSK